MQYTANSAIESKFAAANRVDCYAGRVRRILNGQFHVDFHRHIAKKSAFHADERNLIIQLPRHVIARADVDVFVRQAIANNGLDRFRL